MIQINSINFLVLKIFELSKRELMTIVAILFVLFTILILGMFIMKKNKFLKGKKATRLQTTKKKNTQPIDIESLKSEINQLKAEVGRLKAEAKKSSNKINALEKEINEIKKKEGLTLTENKETKNVKVWNSDELKEPLIFYAGKPTNDRKWEEVTESPNEAKTIFKLSNFPNDKTKANFEVIITSDYMQREITNSPDSNLYRVCTNENANYEFTNKIITTKKGVANLVDGVWTVNEKDKAHIKFQ